MKKKVLLIFYLTTIFNYTGFGQMDSIKNNITTNIASGIISQEVGLYYDLKHTNKSILEFSYAHRFHNLTIIENGGDGGEYKIWKQTGDIARIGYKIFYNSINKYSVFNPYIYYRLSYWNLHTPIYTTRYGSNGLNSTKREVVSVDKNLINFAIGFGKSEQIDEHFYSDFFLILGVSAGQKKTHKYSYGYSGSGNEYQYPSNTFERTVTVLPTLELGINLGYYW